MISPFERFRHGAVVVWDKSQFFADIERNQVSDPARQLLYGLARSSHGTGNLAQLEHEFGRIMDVPSTLQLLVRRELLEPANGEYHFQVELVRRWFARDPQPAGSPPAASKE